VSGICGCAIGSWTFIPNFAYRDAPEVDFRHFGASFPDSLRFKWTDGIPPLPRHTSSSHPPYAPAYLRRVGSGIWRIILRYDALDPVVIPL
jgi:hypothetical protein